MCIGRHSIIYFPLINRSVTFPGARWSLTFAGHRRNRAVQSFRTPETEGILHEPENKDGILYAVATEQSLRFDREPENPFQSHVSHPVRSLECLAGEEVEDGSRA